VETPGPKGVVAVEAKDAWDVEVVILKGLERSAGHKEEQQFGRWIGALETCF